MDCAGAGDVGVDGSDAAKGPALNGERACATTEVEGAIDKRGTGSLRQIAINGDAAVGIRYSDK